MSIYRWRITKDRLDADDAVGHNAQGVDVESGISLVHFDELELLADEHLAAGPPDPLRSILIYPLRNSEHFQNLLRFIMFGYCLLGEWWN